MTHRRCATSRPWEGVFLRGLWVIHERIMIPGTQYGPLLFRVTMQPNWPPWTQSRSPFSSTWGKELAAFAAGFHWAQQTLDEKQAMRGNHPESCLLPLVEGVKRLDLGFNRNGALWSSGCAEVELGRSLWLWLFLGWLMPPGKGHVSHYTLSLVILLT